MAARALNEQEKVLHQAALAKTTRVISIDEVKALVPDEQTRILALNFLLSAGLFRASCDDKGAVVAFRALEQDELESVKDLTIDEISCLHYIRVAGDQGMSSRKLRTSTGLHKAAMEKSVKTLVNRKLIKVIKGSLHNTRQRTFILYDLEPGVEITGGSWYTDKKIDVEFIDQVKSFCLRYIVDRTLPKPCDSAPETQRFYPPSESWRYPSASCIHDSIKRTKITLVELSLREVEALLHVLVLDGLVERIPLTSCSSSHSGGSTIDSPWTENSFETNGPLEDPTTTSDDELALSPSPRGLPFGSAADGKRKRDRSPDDTDDPDAQRTHKRHKKPESTSSNYVYRAIPQPHATMTSLVGQWQNPCGPCPLISFCKSGGPVDPVECSYYTTWLDMSGCAPPPQECGN